MKPKHKTVTDDLGTKHTVTNDAADNTCPGLYAHKIWPTDK